jgi:phage tail sheath protein FI
MPAQTTYPGVYVLEKPSGSVSISSVSTSIALFVGRTQRGPLRMPTLVLNRTSFEKQFGTDTSISEMTDQVRQFFLNGGSQAYIMRIVDDATAATASVAVDNEFGAPALTFAATGPGAIGDTIRVVVDYATSRPETTFNLSVYRESMSPGGQIQQVESERHIDMSMDPASARFVVDYLAQASNLIQATVPGAPPVVLQGYSIAGALGANAAAVVVLVQAAIAAAVLAAPGATGGAFEISVDEQPFVPVTLTTALTVDIPSIQTQINNALAAASLSVRVTAAPSAAIAGLVGLQLTSNQAAALGTSVRVRRAPGPNDIAGPLQMTADDGAIEVGGAMLARPMANGIVARPFTIGGVVGPIGAVFAAAPTPTTLNLTDPAPIAIPIAFPIPGAASLLADAGGASTLGTGRSNLDAFVTDFNNSPAQPVPPRWAAARWGLRVALTSKLGTADIGPAVTLSTVGGGLNGLLGGAASYLPATPAAVAPFIGEANVTAYRLGLFVQGTAYPFASGTGGSDGAAPPPGRYNDAYDIVAREVDLFNMLMLPRDHDAAQTEAVRAGLWGPASAFCLRRRAVLFIDPSTAWRNVNQAKAGVIGARAGLIRDYAAAYWPQVTIIDSDSGATRTIDPCGTVAGVCARIDGSRGVWKAAAGLEASTVLRGVAIRMSNDENGVINPEALNAIRSFPNGIVVWGARTMDGFDNSGNTDYRYLPVRRTALMIEESLYRGLQFAVFEPNDERLWAQIRTAAGSFMNGLFRQGAFQGLKTSDAYFVKCDSETTTQTDINLGVVNVLVGFAALRPAEFVVLTIQQMAGQVQT